MGLSYQFEKDHKDKQIPKTIYQTALVVCWFNNQHSKKIPGLYTADFHGVYALTMTNFKIQTSATEGGIGYKSTQFDFLSS